MTGGRRLHAVAPPGSGAAILDEVRATLVRYVVFPSEAAADAVTLFAAATHVQAKLQFAPRLHVKSPIKRCGKTLLLDILSLLVRSPMMTMDISAAALVRSIADDPPTIILDEADAIFGKGLKGDEKAEALRGILNAGFGRGRPYLRWDHNHRTVEKCPTFAMAIIGGIGRLPDTVEDRSVIINLQRKAPGERVEKYRLRIHADAVKKVGERLGEWIKDYAQAIADAMPEMPSGLNDRAEDVWEALIAVADAVGGEWPERGRWAARALAGAAEDNAAESSRLLSDLYSVFAGAMAMHTDDILDGLHKITEAPWGDWYSRKLNARDLAQLLAPYEVRPKDVKIGGVNRKGYNRDQLAPVWLKYLPPSFYTQAPSSQADATSATSATAQVKGDFAGATDGLPMGYLNVETPDEVADGSVSELSGATYLTSPVAQVAQVAHDPREKGQRKLTNRVCVVDGVEFEAYRRDAIYCSDPCAKKGQRERKRRPAKIGQCHICLHTGALTKGGICTDRVACSERQAPLEGM